MQPHKVRVVHARTCMGGRGSEIPSFRDHRCPLCRALAAVVAIAHAMRKEGRRSMRREYPTNAEIAAWEDWMML